MTKDLIMIMFSLIGIIFAFVFGILEIHHILYACEGSLL